MYHNHARAMGTRLDMVMHGIERAEGDRVFDRVLSMVSAIEAMLSRFNEHSPVSQLNRLGSRKSVEVEPELFDLLVLCREYYEKSGGLFDIAIGKATGEPGKGDPETIRKLLENSGMDKVELLPGSHSVRFHSDDVELDTGGFGKGYALDRVKSVLLDIGIYSAFISFGDSSILAMGDHPHGTGWKSGINHLFRPGESLYTFDLMNESLSTSGIGPNNIRANPEAHIIHPTRGGIQMDFRHISVASPSAMEAEVLSTALVAGDEEEKAVLIGNFPDCRAIEIEYGPEENFRIRVLSKGPGSG